MLAYSMTNIWYTLFVCMCLYCVSWWCCLGTRHLSGSWFLTAQGYMLDGFGDVTSTVSFCQLSGGVCYPMNLCVDFQALYGPIRPTTVCNYCICIIFEWYFVMLSLYFVHVLFCLYFIYEFIIYHSCIVAPCICACLPLCLGSVKFVLHLV